MPYNLLQCLHDCNRFQAACKVYHSSINASSNRLLPVRLFRPTSAWSNSPAQYVSFRVYDQRNYGSMANYDGGTPSVVIVRAFSSCKSRDGNFHASHFRQDRRFNEIRDAYERANCGYGSTGWFARNSGTILRKSEIVSAVNIWMVV